MPKSTYPRDRFDDLPADSGRVGAHRAENPHMRGWVVFLWAAIATLVLIVAGIFATLVLSGRVSFAPDAAPQPTPTATIEPVIDTAYDVLVLNATPEAGLATQVKDVLVEAGWSADQVNASEAGTGGREGGITTMKRSRKPKTRQLEKTENETIPSTVVTNRYFAVLWI